MAKLPIGIDLGTTYSAIAKWEVKPNSIDSHVYYINDDSKYEMASKVYYEKAEHIDAPLTGYDNTYNKKPIIGEPAIGRGIIRPKLYFSAFKRGMDDNAVIERDGGFKITPVELSTVVLQKLLAIAEDEEGHGTWVPEGIVVSVPAYFNNRQNSNTTEAIKNAIKRQFEGRNGYNENIFLRLIPEPVAAGLDYVFQHPNDIGHGKIVIFDLGGGTFDITIFEVDNDLANRKVTFKTLATDGDDRLGGEDFDATLKTFIIEDEGYNEAEISNDARVTLAAKCTTLKCDLSNSESAEISVPYFIKTQPLEKEVTRKDFEECLAGKRGTRIDYLSDIKDRLTNAFEMAGISFGEIDRCVLIGGSCKIPCIRRMLEEIFSTTKVVMGRISEGVARGASLLAAYELDKRAIERGEEPKYMCRWNEIIILENTAHNLGVKTNKGYSTIIKQNAATPARGIKYFTPTELSEDGKVAIVQTIDVYQGGGSKWANVGFVKMPTIYTHGRQPSEIRIQVEFIAESTQVVSKITVEQGNEDKTDIVVTETLMLSGSSK